MKKILHIILISLFSLTIISCSEDKEESTTDTTAPVIAEVTVVTTPTTDSTPNYTFSSTEAGTITYELLLLLLTPHHMFLWVIQEPSSPHRMEPLGLQ